MKFYEAAVLETNCELLPERIESAQNAIGQRVITIAIDEAERRAITKTLNALANLKRERRPARICGECFDLRDVVTSLNGQTFLVKTAVGEVAVALHTRCVVDWADRNSFQTLCRYEGHALLDHNDFAGPLPNYLGKNGMGRHHHGHRCCKSETRGTS
jgi:hypothetical protein